MASYGRAPPSSTSGSGGGFSSSFQQRSSIFAPSNTTHDGLQSKAPPSATSSSAIFGSGGAFRSLGRLDATTRSNTYEDYSRTLDESTDDDRSSSRHHHRDHESSSSSRHHRTESERPRRDESSFSQRILRGATAATTASHQDTGGAQSQQEIQTTHASLKYKPGERVPLPPFNLYEYKTPQSCVMIGAKGSGKTNILFSLFAGIYERFDYIYVYSLNPGTSSAFSTMTHDHLIVEVFDMASVNRVIEGAEAVFKKYGFKMQVAIVFDDYFTEIEAVKPKDKAVISGMFKRIHHSGISTFYAVHEVKDILPGARASIGCLALCFNANGPLISATYTAFFKGAFACKEDFEAAYRLTCVEKGQCIMLLDTDHGHVLRYYRTRSVKAGEIKAFTVNHPDAYVMLHMYGKPKLDWNTGDNANGGRSDTAASIFMRDIQSQTFVDNAAAAAAAAAATTVIPQKLQHAMDVARKQGKKLTPEAIAAAGPIFEILPDKE